MHYFDPVHGHIPLENYEWELFKTKEMQRLHYIKQLGFMQMSKRFPTAVHTRFSHTLGVLSLAKRICKKLDLPLKTTRIIEISSILHDIGHGPFSHFSEKVVRSLGCNVRHENESKRIVENNDNIERILKKIDGIDKRDISRTIDCGKDNNISIQHEIICGGMDIDRMDYLLRESYYLGLALPKSLDRLISNLQRIEMQYGSQKIETLALHMDSASDANILLLSRIGLRPTLYLEKEHRIFEKLVRETLVKHAEEADANDMISRKNIKKTLFGKDDKPGIMDGELTMILRNLCQDFSNSIIDVPLWSDFNPIVLHWDEISPLLQNDLLELDNLRGGKKYSSLHKLENKFSRELAEAFSEYFTKDEIYVDLPPLGKLDEAHMKIIRDSGSIQRLCDYSRVTQTLERSFQETWSMIVFIRRKDRTKEIPNAKEKEIRSFLGGSQS